MRRVLKIIMVVDWLNQLLLIVDWSYRPICLVANVDWSYRLCLAGNHANILCWRVVFEKVISEEFSG